MNVLRGDESVSCISDNSSWYSDFADKLISGNFLLTALEFHAELIESGRELPILKNFFSNPGNFEHLAANKPEVIYPVSLPRSSSQATLDSLDLTRYSEDGERSNDDRVAVLEFELRKARETIVALRANLTVAAETETKDESLEKSSAVQDVNKVVKSTIKPHEQRALNFLINEYLLLQGYKLTSITFSDENESQDFDDWDDVGLNVKRPVELLSLYREGLKAQGYSSSVSASDASCQVSLDDNDEQKNLQFRIFELEGEVANLSSKLDTMNLEYSKRCGSFENQSNIEVESHTSLSPDPENFEIIDCLKSREESETRSERSNGGWTNIDDKLKRESVELKSDGEFGCEVPNGKQKNQANMFENLSEFSEKLLESSINEECTDITDTSNSEEIKLNHNLKETAIEAYLKNSESHGKGGDDDDDDDDEKHSQAKENSMYFFNNVNNDRSLTDRFRDQFLIDCDMHIPVYNGSEVLTEWFKQTHPKYLKVPQIIDILSESIPKIVPNIILNKREEMAPLLVLAICLNSESSARDKLLNILFNLKKKPQKSERHIILNTLSVIAHIMGPDLVESEILPQCWEQITHKYVERRMLVAESCFMLAPHVSETIRNSLLLSMVKQLLQDREENVRKYAVNILALVVVLASDDDKYSQILETSLCMLSDESSDVCGALQHVLYPVLSQWSVTLRRFQSNLLNQLLVKLKEDKTILVANVLETTLPFLIMTVAESQCLLVESSKTVPSPGKRQEFCKLCQGLCDPAVFYSGPVGQIMGQMDLYTSQSEFETSHWPELEWIFQVFIPTFVDTLNSSWDDTNFTITLIICFRYLCLGLGKNITNYKIKPFLLNKLEECEHFIVAGEQCQYSLIPLFIVGTLSTNLEDQREMDIILRKFICILPSCGIPLTPMEVTIDLLSRYQAWQSVVLDGLWEGVTHQRSTVRSAAAKLFQTVIPNISDGLISMRVLPALITLSSDPEISVKASSVPTLGLLTKCSDKGIKDKVYMTLQSLLQENMNLNNVQITMQLVKTVGETFETCDQYFREEVIVPQLYSISANNSHTTSTDLVEVLTEAFAIVSLSRSHLSYHCIVNSLLPGLRCVETACGQLGLPFRDRIDCMIKEVERRGAASREIASKSVASPSSETRKLLPNSVTTQIVVEDVKNKVTKIFHTKPNTLQNVSGMFKKKS